MLQTRDVGHRVVVRHRTGGVPSLTDLLGTLLTIDSDHLVVRTHDGTEHDIPRDQVVAGKRVPPRPAKHSEIVELEIVSDQAWPAPVHEHLGGWILRAAQGWTTRANSALPLGDPGMPLPTAIDACQQWYAQRGLPARIAVPLPLCRQIAAMLQTRAWRAQPDVLVQTAGLADILRSPEPDLPPAQLCDIPSADFLAVVAARKRSLPAAALHVLTGAPLVCFAELRALDGTLAAIARGAVVRQHLHIGLVEVLPAARRRGLARHLTLTLARWALGHGATTAMLQVEEHNTAAVALYSQQGFTTHHRYVAYDASPRT